MTTLQWSQWVVLGHSWQMLPSASRLYCPIHLALCPIDGGITWQPQESPLHPMSTGEGVAIWTAETTFIAYTPTGRHFCFLLAWTVNCSVSGPGEEGSSPLLGYEPCGWETILCLAMVIHRTLIWVPGSVFVLSWSSCSFPNCPKSALWGAPQFSQLSNFVTEYIILGFFLSHCLHQISLWVMLIPWLYIS